MIAGSLWLASGMASPASAQDLIHSDLPLWSERHAEQIWPKAFVDGLSFGCAYNIQLGDWKFTGAAPSFLGEWLRFDTIGVESCAFLVGEGERQDGLDGATSKPAFLIDLGASETGQSGVGIWALQVGMRPGSDYLLLTSVASAKPVARFRILPVHCPATNRRFGESLAHLDNSYCAIGSRAELTALARQMAKLEPVGELKFVAPAPRGAGR